MHNKDCSIGGIFWEIYVKYRKVLKSWVNEIAAANII